MKEIVNYQRIETALQYIAQNLNDWLGESTVGGFS